MPINGKYLLTPTRSHVSLNRVMITLRLPSKLVHAQDFSAKMAPYWVAAALAALFSVFYAYAFRWSEQVAFYYLGDTSFWGFILIPIAIFSSTLLAEIFAPPAAGSGIPQLIAGVELARDSHPFVDKLLSIRVIVVKFIGSCVCVAGGGITGREGPNLQISAAIFNQVYRYWPSAKNLVDRQAMILAGGAAGLAAAFNTPLGGVVFAIEELAKVHIRQVRTAIFHAVLIAGLLAQAILGNYLFLGKSALKLHGLNEVLVLALTAAVVGAAGGLFGVASSWAVHWRSQQSFSKRMLLTFVCAMGVAFIYYFGGRAALGSGRHLILELLNRPQESVSWSLGAIRGFGNLLTYAGGVVGGVFAPALSTGASLGAWISQLLSGQTKPLFILVGMVAFLTGLTRTPFTSTILVLEMTDSHDVILALMLGAIVAQGVAKLIDPVSFYEQAAHLYLKKATEHQ